MSEEDGRDWAEMAQLRQGLYRFFGGGLLVPDRHRFEAILDAAGVLDGAGIEDFAFALPWRRFTDTLDTLPPLEDLDAEYIRLFVSGAGGGACPAVESEYTARPGPGAALVAVELEAEYATLGLELAGSMAATADHAATELEAMAVLCHREAHAWEEDALAAVVEVLRAEWSFLHQHLGRWLPLFAHRLRDHAPAGFYPALVDAADAFVQHDRELVASLAQARSGSRR
jgi:TorA maturation chaperone TorD